jgi:hypothetical protein
MHKVSVVFPLFCPTPVHRTRHHDRSSSGSLVIDMKPELKLNSVGF